MRLMNKKGEEFAEAAVVLPLTILIILSMIMTALFLFEHELRQSEAHAALSREASLSRQVFGIKRREVSSSKFIGGFLKKNAGKTDHLRVYVITQADAVMLGELIK